MRQESRAAWHRDKRWVACQARTRRGWPGRGRQGIVLGAALLLGVGWGGPVAAVERSLLNAMLHSITEGDLRRHVEVLAADTYEGREGGSRGGRAAGVYLEGELRRLGIAGGAAQGGYFQPFAGNQRNLLAVIPGSDPELADEVIVVAAHYDHVGYGNRDNSFGPIGYIHNGADDNASGTAGLLELIEAYQSSGAQPKRTLLFALWDGEEKGLLGSYHWCAHPTVPLNRVPLMVNLDMIGRLRADRMEVVGARTAPGLRELVARNNLAPGLRLDYTWQLREDSDHYAFFRAGVPAVMLHTGLHDDYHRPSDDVELLNLPGIRQVTQLLVRLVDDLAEGADVGPYRSAAGRETPELRQTRERPLPPLPGRLGVTVRPSSNVAGVELVGVDPESAAARAGLNPGDVVTSLAGRPTPQVPELLAAVARAENPVELEIVRAGATDAERVSLELAGQPLRIGISWRTDDAEPRAVALARVVPGSPAEAAGLEVNDRVYRVNGQDFATSEAFAALLADAGPWTLEIEREGRISELELALPDAAPLGE